MLEIRTIIVPIDFSKRSEPSIEHADALAQLFDARLEIVHVVPPSPHEYAAFDEGFYAAAAAPGLQRFQEALEQRMTSTLERRKPKSPYASAVRRGDPAGEIESFTQEKQGDLLVMPTHGYGAFRRFMLGSVTNKVLHDVKIPVFTGVHVPEISEFDPEPYKRVACAVDLHEHSEETLRWAWDLAKACEEDLLVIHAAPQLEASGSYGDWFPPDTTEQVVEGAKKSVRALMAKVGCEGQVVVESAEPVRFIRKAAEENYADLLVVGRRPHKGILSGLREHAYAIIREAPCPVISV